MSDETRGNPLREVGTPFRWEFMNPNIRSRSIKTKGLLDKDDYKYYLTVEISKEFHELLVDAKRTGMIVANIGQVVGDELPKPTKPLLCVAAWDHKEEYGNQNPSNLAHLQCSQPKFWEFITQQNTELSASSFETAKDYVKTMCEIKSFTELDTNQNACITFLALTDDYREFVNG